MTQETNLNDTVLNLNEKVQSITLDLAAKARVLSQTSNENDQLRVELAEARNRPSKQIVERILFKLLRSLSKKTWLFSEKRRQRFFKSAAKRDPMRSVRALSVATAQVAAIPFGKRVSHSGDIPSNPAKKNVLLVCHEASQTGAPILGYNIAIELSRLYNVTIVCLRGGPITTALQSACSWIEVLEGVAAPGNQTWNAMKDLLLKKHYTFAITNSVESRSVLPLLKEVKVPSVALLHEFASYTLPSTAFLEVDRYADEIVFSSQITLDNALDTLGFWMSPNMHILPQGKSGVPEQDKSEGAKTLEQQRLKLQLRKAAEDDLLVIGAGTVVFRKGVELFIEVARATLEKTNGRGVKFCWIGSGYRPDQDSLYSVYLRDQIQRSGIEENFTMLGHTTEIDYVHELSDLFLLTSRLDPLPNVAIDAMAAGNPVLCFENASGFSPILKDAGIGDACVAKYLDTSDMADKLSALVSDRAKLKTLSETSKSLADQTFNMELYVAALAKLGEASAKRATHAEDDKQIILDHKSRHFESYISPDKQDAQVVANYLRRPTRRPEPGFNPHIFEESMRSQGMEISNPYATYLRLGRPEGPWRIGVLNGPGSRKASSLRVALHIHAYYTDELPRILKHLDANETRPDLYISVADDVGEAAALDYTAKYPQKVEIHQFPNIGRDIGPFITGFGPSLIDKYDVIGHVHTKKSLALSDAKLIKKWTDFLYENVLGGSVGGAMIDVSLAEFKDDPALGLIYPSDPNIIGWTLNRGPAVKMMRLFGEEKLPDYFDFPVGTMFWMNATVLREFVELRLDWSDYPKEPIPIDGTMLHAIERMFGLIPRMKGYAAKVTFIEGVSR